MELDKRKYKKSAVQEILDEISKDYESKLSEQKNIINELMEENKKLSSALSEYKEKDSQISFALKEAKSFEESNNTKLSLKYDLEVKKIKAFSKRFKSYFDYLIKKYPYYGEITKAKEIFDKINNILENNDAKKAVSKIGKILPTEKTKNLNTMFDPKQKINDYIASTSDSGFDMNDVLNPGELKLEDICKELGLIENE